jgi:hypothetical protein|tara:strand:+ start:1681 stop:1899 length:219 start_codon:yes stop_codon:yes gene_type:complete
MANNKPFNTSKAFIVQEVKRTLKVLNQTGKQPDLVRDRSRRASLPGKRISKTGKVYWETRKNRSDASLAKKI